MAELKTKQNNASVSDFLNGVADAKRRQDCFSVLELMRETTHAEPQMWGGSIVGFGSYRYRYASGREGDWMLTGFAPRKQNLVVYIMAGFGRYDELLAQLGPHKTGQSCLYIKDLDKINRAVLRELIAQSVAHIQADQVLL